MGSVAVEVTNIVKSYAQTPVLRNVDLTIESGKFVSLLGPSGCGKTTMLRLIAGLEQPDTGDISVLGRRVNDVPVHQRNIGMVFQNHALFPHMSVFDNVAFGLKYRNLSKPEIIARVKRALEIVRLPHLEGRLPRQLSGGQQQRVAVARAIVIQPDLLLFDEPLSALDANLREEMRIELKRIQHSLGITTIFVTHDQSEAMSMSDIVILMREGVIDQYGRPDQLYNDPETDFAARFFGQVNEIDGIVAAISGDGAKIDTPLGTVSGVRGDFAIGDKVTLLLRSERSRVAGQPDLDASQLPCRVLERDYLGMLVRYTVLANDQQINVVQALEGELLSVGADAYLKIPTSAWLCYR